MLLLAQLTIGSILDRVKENWDYVVPLASGLIVYRCGFTPESSLVLTLLGIVITNQRKHNVKPTIEDLLSLLPRDNADILFSEKDRLNRFCKEYHFYYQSFENETSHWRYVKLNLEKNIQKGCLLTSFNICRPSLDLGSEQEIPNEIKYNFYFYFVSNQLITIGSNETLDNKETLVISFPNFNEDIQTNSVACGIQIHQDWDKKWRYTPAIISQTAIHECDTTTYGILRDQKDLDQLSNKWKEREVFVSQPSFVQQEIDRQQQGNEREIWSCNVPDNTKISREQSTNLAIKLSYIRDRAGQILSEHQSGFDQSNIRANIFIPSKRGEEGYAYRLERPSPLKASTSPTQNSQSDNEFFLSPGEGVSGDTFLKGTSSVSCDRLEKLPKWDERVDSELKWIISIPISLENKPPLAVLNIDCVREEIDRRILEEQILQDTEIKGLVKEISEEVDSLPKKKVSIKEEDI